MIYTYPDYYEKFQCIAGSCEATCCAGWQIVIDDESLEKYKSICQNENRIEQEKRIDWNEGVFYQREDRRCAFLNEENLCDMYTEWGEEALCNTCSRYPRHIEEFENVREYTLSLSCPEAARIILGNKDKVSFVEREDDIEETDEDFDVFMYSMLEDARDVIYKIIQNRDVAISHRVELVIGMAEELQKVYEDEGVFACSEVIDAYSDVDEAECHGINCKEDKVDKYEKSLVHFKKLYELEVLNDIWIQMTDETAKDIYVDGKSNYERLHLEFRVWLDENIKDHNIIWEQIMLYFISTYFCGAVYDDNIVGKVNMAVTSLTCIYELLLSRWLKNGRYLDFDDIVFVAYMYSRELEHSDINLEIMEG